MANQIAAPQSAFCTTCIDCRYSDKELRHYDGLYEDKFILYVVPGPAYALSFIDGGEVRFPIYFSAWLTSLAITRDLHKTTIIELSDHCSCSFFEQAVDEDGPKGDPLYLASDSAAAKSTIHKLYLTTSARNLVTFFQQGKGKGGGVDISDPIWKMLEGRKHSAKGEPLPLTIKLSYSPRTGPDDVDNVETVGEPLVVWA